MNALLSSPVLSWLLSYLFNALWQIPLLFAAAWLATRMLRRAHPRVEHRVWVAALLLQIALPACSLHIGTLWASMWVTLRSLTFFWKQPSVIRGAETTIFFGPGVPALHAGDGNGGDYADDGLTPLGPQIAGGDEELEPQRTTALPAPTLS